MPRIPYRVRIGDAFPGVAHCERHGYSTDAPRQSCPESGRLANFLRVDRVTNAANGLD